MTASDVPEDIFQAAKVIKELEGKTYKSRVDLDNLNRAKLRIAFWACRNENIVASRENLAYVLGSDAKDIMAAYDRYLEREEEEKSKEGATEVKEKGKTGTTTTTRKKTGNFWENA